jgi:hypothetical protein
MLNGGPAFPAECDNDFYKGMTLRDWFAAKAPVSIGDAICAANMESSSQSIEVAVARVMVDPAKRAKAFAMLAKLRMEYADAMLEARK